MNIDINLVNSLKVGEFITIDTNKALLCTVGKCINCHFYYSDKCDYIICYSRDRLDNKDVMYVIVDNDIKNTL